MDGKDLHGHTVRVNYANDRPGGGLHGHFGVGSGYSSGRFGAGGGGYGGSRGGYTGSPGGYGGNGVDGSGGDISFGSGNSAGQQFNSQDDLDDQPDYANKRT